MAEARKPKQEQEDAAPDVAEVAPNVLRMQLPISMPGLGHVNAYALVDHRGAAVVDPGMPGPKSWSALGDRLAKAGLALRDVHTVVVTHSHPDHFGGAGRLAAEAGADVVTHAAFRSWWTPHRHDHDDADHTSDAGSDVDPADLPPPRTTSGPPWSGPTPWGGKGFRPPLRRRVAYRVMGSRFGRRFQPPEPTSRLRHGDVVKLAGREWHAVHTPGHTLDHLCLHDPETGVLLSGDHVLPTITPHISGMNTGRDPLALFFDSLDRVAALDRVTTVLPAHGHPFTDVAARVGAIKEHHRDRLDRLRIAAAEIGGAATVEEFSHHLFRQARWGPMAESETYAHLEHLRIAGLATSHELRGVVRFEVEPLRV
ncbi:MAG TPA: MBL fold metallo-hydrolase [Acidimicrobiales bacterium]